MKPTLDFPIGAAIEACIRSKKEANRRPVYINELNRMLRSFTLGVEELPVSMVSQQDVENWLATKPWAPATRRSAMTRLSAFFSFAVRRGWIGFNPVTRLDPVIVEPKPPRIFTPDEAENYLTAVWQTAPVLLPCTVLGLYAGLRTAEIQKISWADIDLDRGFIRVDACVSKVRQRRIVPLEPKAVGLLAPLVGRRLNVPRWSQRMPRMRVALRMGWMQPSNILRATAASYLLALHQDCGKVARMLGHSPDVLLRFYADLVTPEDCAAFWNIRPTIEPP